MPGKRLASGLAKGKFKHDNNEESGITRIVMTIYLLFIGIVILLLSADYLYRKNGYGPLTLFALFLTTCLVVMRYETGYDYQNYVDIYLSDFSSLAGRKLEWGFVGLVGVLRILQAGPYWMFFLVGVSIVCLALRCIKLYTSNVRIALLIYLLTPGLFLNSLSILRQADAIVLVFYAFYYAYNKRYRTFWGFYLMGCLFHYSCLLVLPFFLLAPKLQNNARLLVLIGIPVSLVLSKIDLIGFLLSHLLSGTKFVFYAGFEDAGTSFAKLLVLNASVVLYLFFYRGMDRLDRSLLVLVTMGLILLNICSNIGAVTRMSYYFRIFETVLLANIVSRFGAMRSRIVACTCITVYYFTMFYTSLSFDFHQVDSYPKLTPYQSILNR